MVVVWEPCVCSGCHRWSWWRVSRCHQWAWVGVKHQQIIPLLYLQRSELTYFWFAIMKYRKGNNKMALLLYHVLSICINTVGPILMAARNILADCLAKSAPRLSLQRGFRCEAHHLRWETRKIKILEELKVTLLTFQFHSCFFMKE